MRWTYETPTQDGYYWCLCMGSTNKPMIAEVVNYATEAILVDGRFPTHCSIFLQWSNEPISLPEGNL